MDTDEDMLGIVCCFRKIDERTRKSWMNWFASQWSASPYIHAEFYFMFDAVTVTVDTRKPVTFIDYGNDYSDRNKWECYVIWVHRSNYVRVYNYCRKQERKPFDKSGIYCFGCTRLCTSGSDGEAWICTRLMCEALKKGDVLDYSVDSYSITPTRLRELILEQNRWNVERYKS